MKNTLTKIGLTGNSGMFPCTTSSNGKNVESVGFLHISAPYDSGNGRVFVETKDHWERVTQFDAKRYKRRVISCAYCDNPAVRLDHLWPYHAEMNACREHLDWYSEWECGSARSIGKLCRVVDGKLSVVKDLIA
jgi:hypothetical protein